MRAVAVGRAGDAAIIAEQPWPLFTPEDAAPFGREFDGDRVRVSLLELLERAAGEPFAAIAFTGQREGLAFLDGNHEPLLVSPNIDARAATEGIAIDAARAGDVYGTTGHLPSLMQAPAKLEWLRRNRPDVAARVQSVIPLADWLASILTGAPVMSRSLAAENGLLDIRSGFVARDLLSRLGFDAGLAPQLVSEGSITGAVSNGGLGGTPVVLAGADTQCALLGMGAVSPGSAAVPAGWSAPVQLVTENPLFDEAIRTWTGLHVAAHGYVLESNAGETGRVWQWICDLCGVDVHEADCLAGSSPVGARDVMTVVGAGAMNAAAMNAGIGGVTLPLPLAMSDAGRADVLRSVLESIACAIRANVEQLEEIAGAGVDGLRLGGGMSRSATFAQLLADVLDRPVEVASTSQCSAVGAAMLAFVAAGTHASVDAAAAAMRRASTITPDARASANYEDVYSRWTAMTAAFVQMASEV